MKHRNILALGYIFLAAICFFPPTSPTEVQSGIAILLLTLLYWRTDYDFERLLKISNDLADANTRLIKASVNSVASCKKS